MSAPLLKLGGVELPTMSRSFSESEIEITREDRTASGRLVIDVIAVKKTFTVQYAIVTEEILSVINEVYKLGNPLNFVVERKSGELDEYTVRLHPYSRDRLILGDDWFWEGITLELEEV